MKNACIFIIKILICKVHHMTPFLLSYSVEESKYWCFSIDFLFNVDWSLEALKMRQNHHWIIIKAVCMIFILYIGKHDK